MPIPSSTSPSSFASAPYDYLILGGGTAGLVVAARLSEDPRIRVGVLEAGPPALDAAAISVPGRYGEALGSRLDWRFETTPQAGLRGRWLAWPRGKVLGGTSAINFMTWNRPDRGDLDAWEELGNRGWGWDGLLPYYKKSENFLRPDDSHPEHHKLYDPAYLGTGGPLQVSYTKEHSASHKYWHETLNNLDMPTNTSHLSGSNVGVWTTVVTVDPKTCTRAYSATAYYLPNAARKNLTLLTGALVREIILEQHGGEWEAKGVRFVCGEDEFTAMATKEVIVSAGSVMSPQLLELSGIGNPSVLGAAGIPVKVNNPNVGENLQDHIMAATIYSIDPTTPTPDDLRTDPALAAAADLAYATTQSGPRTVLPCSLAYVPLSHFVPHRSLAAFAARATSPPPHPSARDRIRARRFADPALRLGQIEFIFDVGNWSDAMPVRPGQKYATLLHILQYPFSTGSVHVAPASAAGTADDADHAKPVIDPGYYAGAGGAVDRDVLRLCVQYGDALVRTAPLSQLVQGGRVWPAPPAAGASGAAARDDEEEEVREEWVEENTTTDWHPVGTCSMGGSEGAEGGVVDERLRVYGVRGLRVVDASVMPLQISAHLQATVYAIAEKASAMILEDGAW